MKGQMVFEFIVATVIFIGVVLYVVLLLNSTVASYTGDYNKNALNEKALRISEVLVHSPGVWEPISGTTPTIYRPMQAGFSADWPVLNDTEIKYMAAYCANGYGRTGIVDLFGIGGETLAEGVGIRISNSTNGSILDCMTGTPFLEHAYAERVAYTPESKTVKVGVTVW
jgi:hypothetical protein